MILKPTFVTIPVCCRLSQIMALIIFSTIFVNVSVSFSEPYVYGTITDTHGAAVSNADIVFLYNGTNETAFSGMSDVNGFYEIDSSLLIENTLGNAPRSFMLSQNYPNPFNPATLIPVAVTETQQLTVTVYNSLGQKVRQLEDNIFTAGSYSISWDGRDENGGDLGAGIYFCRIQTADYSDTIKMLKIDGGGISVSRALSLTHVTASRIAVQTYDIEISANGISPFEQKNVLVKQGSRIDFTVTRIDDVPFKCIGNYIAIRKDGDYVPIFIKGVNLGVGIPGRHPGELAPTREQYRHWLERISECGFNSLRIYTLHSPRFYEEFAAYNEEYTDNPLYLFQGIWLDEENPGNDLHTMTGVFDEEIEMAVNCIHGNAQIEYRAGKAHGTYTNDISRWIIGFIIGREIYPTEVIATNELHSEITAFTGTAVMLANGTPSEIWATERLEKLITYERDRYNVQRPASFSSWPTLDPLEHLTEPDFSLEDIVAIDLEPLETFNAPAGVFASYHAYPYYPDFMNEDTGYQTFYDDQGQNNYIGYLTELKRHHASRPLLIAEYGVPSSWGNAHSSISGMNHGGLDEVQQGHYNNRMLHNIYDTDCGGGMLFALFDEWFKNSWITSPLNPDTERRPLFHNVTNPEQNFGLIAFDSGEPDFEYWPETNGDGPINRLRSAYNHEYFYLKIELDHDFSETDTVVVAYDTYRSDLGESVLPNGTIVTNRAEFALEISHETAQLYVTEAYDIFGIWHGVAGPEQLFHSVPSDNARWNRVMWKNNIGEMDVQDIGLLGIHGDGETESSLDAVAITENRIEIRIPWALLQFTDPSMMMLIDDDRNTAERETTRSDGISVSVSTGSELIATGRLLWETWNTPPVTVERDKASYYIVKEGLNSVPDIPEIDYEITLR